MFLVMSCLKKQTIFSTHLVIQKKALTAKSLPLRDKNLVFDFRDYSFLKELFRDIYYKKFTIKEAERVQD